MVYVGSNMGAWSETAFISIAWYGDGLQSSNDISFAALTETVDIDMGDKDVEQVTTLIGGKVIKKVPMDITTITFEGYPVDLDAANGTGISPLFNDLKANWDATEPMAQTSTLNRDLYRIAIMWTDDPAATTAHGTVTSTYKGYRMVFAHAYCTSAKTSFTDGILKVTFTFKVRAFNKNGIGCIHEDSVDGTAGMLACATYNATNFSPTATTAYTWVA